MYKTIVFIAMTISSVPVNAATWGLLKAYSNQSINFYDADSLVKNKDTVTLWTKNVTEENTPDTDGIYATASRSVYSCKKRTYQLLTMSVYDKKGNFIRSYSKQSDSFAIVPDTVGESILKEVCASDFPFKSNIILNNDIYTFTKTYFDYLKAAKEDPAPK